MANRIVAVRIGREPAFALETEGLQGGAQAFGETDLLGPGEHAARFLPPRLTFQEGHFLHCRTSYGEPTSAARTGRPFARST